MDYTTKAGLLIGAVVVLGILWAVWKFFTAIFKYVLIGSVVVAVGVGLTLYRMMPPPKNPAFGKHAYLKENGKYLGVVETQGEDNHSVEVWGVRLPGDHLKMYSKSRVELKEKYEPPPAP
ncbi:MAG: hypothetical protein ACREEM_55705, partial [Blastocatellia bacterium]